LRERLFLAVSGVAVACWSAFIYVAITSGAEYSWEAIVNGRIYLGPIPSREIFFVVCQVIISFVAFRLIRIINGFKGQTEKQQIEIEKRIEQMHNMNLEIRDKVNMLFTEVDSQNTLVMKFNDRMQSQAATFEEISATLEELRGSSESIHNSTIEQIDGHVKMDEIVDDFKHIKKRPGRT
jgi:hypothetical protein